MLTSVVTSVAESTSCLVVEFKMMRRSVMKRTAVAVLVLFAACLLTPLGALGQQDSTHCGKALGPEDCKELRARQAIAAAKVAQGLSQSEMKPAQEKAEQGQQVSTQQVPPQWMSECG